MQKLRFITTGALLLGLAACGDSTNATTGAGGENPSVTAVGVASTSDAASSVSSSASSGTGGAPFVDPCGDTDIPIQDLGTGAADPAGGVFTLSQALDGLADGPGPLRAVIDTEKGIITCQLFDTDVPNGVANFVGLARGRRPFRDPKTHHWMQGKRFYDGLIFHRVIDNFVAQGGDPLGTGVGGPGYSFADEIVGKSHVPGTLAYANSGPNTNGSQYYIVAEVAQPSLDADYTIFGLCTPVDVPKAITEVPTNANDKPITPIHMTTVCITRAAP